MFYIQSGCVVCKEKDSAAKLVLRCISLKKGYKAISSLGIAAKAQCHYLRSPTFSEVAEQKKNPRQLIQEAIKDHRTASKELQAPLASVKVSVCD